MQVAPAKIAVEVVFALPHEQCCVSLSVAADTTLRQAIELSGLRLRYPEIAQNRLTYGIFGKSVNADSTLRDGDRIEIYRPLSADPKDARRMRQAGKSG